MTSLNIPDIPEKPRKLSSREERHIKHRLLACSSMAVPSSRETILSDLNQAIDGISTHISRSPIATFDIANIFDTCIYYPNAFKELIEIVAYYEGDSDPMRELKDRLELYFHTPTLKTLISQELFGKLLEIIRDVRIEKVKLIQIYYVCTDDGWQDTENDNDDEYTLLARMIRKVVEMEPVDGIPKHFLKFVALLGTLTEPQVARELEAWCKNAMQKIEDAVKVQVQNALPAQGGADTPSVDEASFHLLVKFGAETFPYNSGDEVAIRAWLLRKQGNTDPKTVMKWEVVYRLGDAPDFLQEWIGDCEAYTHHFTVELFLPLALLNHEHCDVHAWSYETEYGPQLISLQYPLFLRLHDRMYRFTGKNQVLWRAWQSNWANAMNGGSLKILTTQECIDRGQYLSVHLEECGCVAITFVPAKFDSSKDIFNQMVKAGTSIALWPRRYGQSVDEQAIKQLYQELLNGHDFSKLPELLLRKRREKPEQGENAPINTLTLFWDKPYPPLPPDAVIPEFKFA